MPVKLGENGWTASWWTAFRIAMGLYVFGHFALLLPWTPELFSSAGMLPDASSSPIFRVFPNVLAITDAPWMVRVLCGLGALSGLGLIANRWPRVAAVVAWYVGACFLGRNPLILNPAMPHVGWTLLWFAAIRGPVTDEAWSLPNEMYAAAWMLMGLLMAWSAGTKIASPSWMDGSALLWVWENPLARDTALRTGLTQLPAPLIHGASWFVLALEFVALPAVLAPRLRPFVWLGLLCMHIGLLLTVDFADLSTGMLVVHAVLFDPRWLPAWIREWRPVPRPQGAR